MAIPMPLVKTTTTRRFVMTPRRWTTLAAICFLAAAYYLCYEHFPVYVTKDTPLYRATRNGKQGVVTTGGRIVIPFLWEEIGAFDNHGMAYVAYNDPQRDPHSTDPSVGEWFYKKYGVINRSSKMIIPATLTDLSWRFDDQDEFQGIRNQQLVNFDRSGKEKWRSEWLPIDQCRFGKLGLLAVRQGNETGWIDRKGKLVLSPPEGLEAASNFEECGLALVRNEERLVGCIDKHGMIIIPAEWTAIDIRGNAMILDGKVVLADPLFVKVSNGPDSESRDCVQGLYSPNGHCIVPARYFDLEICYEGKVVSGRHLDGTYRVLDFQGKELPLPTDLEDLELATGVDLIIAKRDGKYGWFDFHGQVAIPFEYDGVLSRTAFRYNGLAVVAKNRRWGVIDRDGRIVVPFDFDGVSDSLIRHDLFVATKDKQLGCLDASGKTVLPFEFFSLGDTATSEYIAGSKEGQAVLFDTKGRQHLNLNDVIFQRLPKQLLAFQPKSLSHLSEVLDPADPLLRARDTTTDGDGVFHTTHGMIVPPVHYTVAFIGNGLEGRGLIRPDSSFNRYSSFILEKLSERMPSIVPPSNEVQVIYDINGNVIWRNDARLIDFLKAFGLSCWGLYCFRRYRIAKREQRMLQAA